MRYFRTKNIKKYSPQRTQRAQRFFRRRATAKSREDKNRGNRCFMYMFRVHGVIGCEIL